MSTPHRKSKLDRFSVALLAVGGVLFLISAFSYLVALYILLTPPPDDLPPEFTLIEIANMAGIAGMIVIPMFIITALIVNYREKRRDKKTGIDSDDNPQPGTAGSS